MNELNQAINNTKSYDAEKLKHIEDIKRSHKGERNNSPASQYDLSSKLYEEYKISILTQLFYMQKDQNKLHIS